MLDLKFIRENREEVEERLSTRGIKIDFSELLEWDSGRRKLISEIDALREKRKKTSEQVGLLKKEKKPAEKLMKETEEIRETIQNKEKILLDLENKIEEFMLTVPNLPDESVPTGKSEKDNKKIRENLETGEQKLDKPKPHWELGSKLGIIDFEIATKMSSSRFAVLKDRGAVLERAIISFMLDLHTKQHGYTEVMTPYLVNKKSITGTGQLPKFKEEVFKCADDEFYLIPTAEVTIANLHSDEIFDKDALPKKYVSYSACFRREAGSYGKDTKGLIRNHQFNKVELFKFTKPEDSADELEKLLNDAEDVLKQLKLPYRVIELCGADLGFTSAKTYDLEVWMPGEKMWREVSSCSNCRDFQSRRLNIKVRTENNKEYVHTINGSGLAVGRIFAAILENYQNTDGSITIPSALKSYTGFDKIG